jgi:primosomal replication protein N
LNCNQTTICGEISKLGTLRYTPAGVAIIEFGISHASNQIEAGMPRKVLCDISAVALAQIAVIISGMKLGTLVKLTGFLAKKSQMSLQLVLHVDNVVQLLTGK